MIETSPIEISTEEYEEPFTNMIDAFDYFFEQLKLYRPAFGYLIQIGDYKNEKFKVLINQKPIIDAGAAKVSIIAKFQITDILSQAFKIAIAQ